LRERASPNWDERPAGAGPELLVLHYTGMPTAEGALDRLCDPAARVSAHYLIDEDGTVWALVPEERRAWHAGRSWWRGRAGLNDVSVGIELVNPGHEWGYRPFPEAQMAALVPLAQVIMARWAMPAWQVVAHSDIAPDRKEDPGELFDWQRLAGEGIGIWPPPGERLDAVGDARRALAAIGYPLEDQGVLLRQSLVAFQRRFRQRLPDGVADEETLRRLDDVVALLRARGAIS
jgi:N-acetylmuramoyl-L-alanine amidase